MLAYAIRHAESLANVGRANDLNAGLTELGHGQSEALADRFRPVRIDAIYSSPFTRSLETALPVAGALNLPIRIRPELCEHHHLPPGTVVDTCLQTIERITSACPQAIACPDAQVPFDWVPADESFPQLITRMKSLATYLKSRWTGGDDAVILFSHGSPVARLIEAWLVDQAGPSFRFVIDNGAVAALRFHDEISSLVCLNEVSHLQGLSAAEAANYRTDGGIKPQPSSSYW